MPESTAPMNSELIAMEDCTFLPMRCVKTNKLVGKSQYTTWDLPYIPSWLAVGMIFCPALLLVVPFSVRQRCRFKAGLSRGQRCRFFLYKMGLVVAMLLCLALPFYSATISDNFNLLMSIGTTCLLLFWIGFATLVLFTTPLRIVRHEGDLYWIKGCSPDFLESLNVAEA